MKELTVLEEMIMAGIWSLKENAYGVSIRNKVVQLTRKKLMYGTLYNSLDQLVRKGYIVKTIGSPTSERGGRSKIFYLLTEEGKQALKAAYRLHESIWTGIPDLIEEKVK